MRFVAAAVVFLLPVLPGAAAALDYDVTSRIDAVTVFPSGAEVTRVAKVMLEKGEHTIVFRDLPREAVGASIRVEGRATGRLDIGSVDSRRLFVTSDEAARANAERKRLEDELERSRDERADLDAQVQAADTQKALIANLAQLPNRPAPAGEAGQREDWREILSTIAGGSADAQRARRDAEVKIRQVDERISDLEGQLAALAPAQEERTEVRIHVAAAAALEGDVTVRYQVPNASWTPLYDGRLVTGTKSVAPALTLTRRAEIVQRTGEAWEEVAVTLSTTRPTAGASAPELSPLLVDFEPPPPPPRPVAAAPEALRKRGMARDGSGMAGAPADAMAEADEGRFEIAGRGIAAGEVTANVIAAPFQALFQVPGRLSVPATGETKRVQLIEDTVEPALAVRTVPKADAKAFLYAKLVLPKGSPLLPGAVSLFRDGTFVGSGQLPVLSPGEEHELGFGIDDLVRVRHAIEQEKQGETGLISTSKTDTRNYKITVKSMHERAIDVVVFDQMPVSQNQDIKVELTGRTPPSKLNVDDKQGIVSWTSKLEPDQEQVIEFGYRVTWPSARTIIYR